MKTIALFESTGRSEAIKWAEIAANYLHKRGVVVIGTPELAGKSNHEGLQIIQSTPKEQFEKLADVVISFGGDGTMLSAARLLMGSEIPIMGVNVGKLGFLAEFPIKNLEESLGNLLDGNYRVVERTVLDSIVNNETIFALNDIVIEKKNSSRMITVSVFSNDNHVADYRADGLIITTPTGSTAYSLSCGGPIIAPAANVICITPISPHSLTLRPLILPDNTELKIKVYSHSGESALVADGQMQRKLFDEELLIIRKSSNTVRLIKQMDGSYFGLLREKLLWATHAPDREATLTTKNK